MIIDKFIESKIKTYAFVGPSRNRQKLQSSNGGSRKKYKIYNR